MLLHVRTVSKVYFNIFLQVRIRAYDIFYFLISIFFRCKKCRFFKNLYLSIYYISTTSTHFSLWDSTHNDCEKPKFGDNCYIHRGRLIQANDIVEHYANFILITLNYETNVIRKDNNNDRYSMVFLCCFIKKAQKLRWSKTKWVYRKNKLKIIKLNIHDFQEIVIEVIK